MERDQLQGEGDRFLIEEVRAGSADGFRRLVDRYGGRLKAYASRKLYGTGLDPEDAVQETFLSLVRALDQLEGVRSLQAYLFTILRRRIADMARARGPGGTPVSIDVSESSRARPVLAADESTPSTYARRAEAVDVRRLVLADVLDTLLARLKEKKEFRHLKILELIFVHRKSQQDIAAIVKTSEPTVSRTRKSLVEELRRLVARHAQADALQDLTAEQEVDGLITEVWHENLFTCVKRSTLGSYALDVLEADWADYVRFHLETLGCEFCAAHLADVERGGERISASTRDRIFMSSVGFLK